MAPPQLPDDVLHLLCEELANQEQFDTLFNCACAGRALAVPALTNLYRAHHEAPVRGDGDDSYGLSFATKLLTIQRWSILWRSIVASSLDATLFPYCRYIRTLDFRDLGYLLEDDQFKNKVSKQFFAEPLQRFEKSEVRMNIKGRKTIRLRIAEIIDAIGEAVTQHTPTLEIISGELLADALVRWAPRLPRLQGLELWDGKPLEDELMHASMYAYCPQFKSLTIYKWSSEDRDHKFSAFIASMRPNSLKKLVTICDVGAAAETFHALNHHGKSLEDLKICVSNGSLPHLPLLQGCTALKTLRIEDIHGIVDLEATQNDAFLEMIAWLSKCANLQHISFTKLQSGAAMITPVLLEHNIKLANLEVDSYILKDHRAFHQALVHQRSSLRYLSLSGETDGMFRDDLDILVDSLKQLTELRKLWLLLPEVFRDEHVIVIIERLVLLEELYVSGLELNDVVLESTGNLPNIRNVTLSGISKFTADGLYDFIEHLGPGNQGLRLTIGTADPDTMLSEGDLSLVRDRLAEEVGGTLEYITLGDPNVSEFEGDSD